MTHDEWSHFVYKWKSFFYWNTYCIIIYLPVIYVSYMFNTFVIHVVWTNTYYSYLQNVVGYLFANVVVGTDVLTNKILGCKYFIIKLN